MSHLWLLLVLIKSLHIAAENFSINFIKTTGHNDPTQIGCTVVLLKKYFYSGKNLSGSVLHIRITTASTYLQQSLLQALHTHPIYPWTIVVENGQDDNTMESNSKHVLHEKPQCYFFVIDNMKDVDMDEELFETWKGYLNWNPLAQFVVYLTSIEETEEKMTDIMMEIFQKFMNKKIYNVNIIGRNKKYVLYFGKTVFPYHPDNNCGNRVISVETLDVCYYRQESEREQHDDYEENYDEGSFKSNQDSREESEGKDKFSLQNTSSGTSLNSKFVNNVGNPFQVDYAEFYIEEIYRGLFFDKFPQDLSGCPLIAGFRTGEPYIFYETLDKSLYTVETDSEENKETFYNDMSTYGEAEGIDKYDDDNDDDEFIVYNNHQDIERKTAGSLSEIRLNGIEYQLIQTIAKHLHISIEMQMEHNQVFDLFQRLIDGDIEMVMGGIDEDPNISQFVSSSISYLQDDLTWCVARAQKTENLLNFTENLQIDGWLLTLLFIPAASFTIFISQKYLNLRLSCLSSYYRINIYVMGILLGQAIRLRTIPTSLKLSFGITFFMGLMFGNIYQSALFRTLTTSKTLYQITDLHDIIQNRMRIKGSAQAIKHLNKEGEIYHYAREQFLICYDTEKCLQEVAEDSKLAVLASRQHFLYNPRIPHDSIYCFDRNENVYVYLVTILMPKKFHLLPKINKVIRHIIESGLMQSWTRELDIHRKINEEMQLARKGQLTRSLTLSQAAGTFVCMGMLLAFALWIFIMECSVYWLMRVRRRAIFKLATFMHKFI